MFAIKYWSGKNTTTGDPNPRTGRMSKAIDIKYFKTLTERKHYIEKNYEWELCSQKKLRKLCLGNSVETFNKYIEYIKFMADYE